MTHCILDQASLNEIFVSIQGEGPLVGVRQVFIRFSGCNLACDYCDTDHRKKFSCDINFICAYIERCLPLHSVSLTGGEPLLQVKFLKYFLPYFKEKFDLPVYLETNGSLPNQLSEVIDYIDLICMDIKLPSVSGVSPLWDIHKAFIESIPIRKKLIVKIVVSPKINSFEKTQVERLLSQLERTMFVILQPLYGEEKNKDFMKDLLIWQKRLMMILNSEIRVVPQVHNFLGVR